MGIGNPNEEYGRVRSSGIEQSTYQKDLEAQRITDIPSNMTMRIEYDASDRVKYMGYGAKGLSEAVGGWLLYEVIYDGETENITSKKVAYGSWEGRAAATYE